MEKAIKNQRDVKSYPQDIVKNDIFMLDIPLNFNEKSDLSTDLSTGIKKYGVGVQFLHPPLVQKLHPNNIKFFNNNTRSKKGGIFQKVIHRLKILLFSRKKELNNMIYDDLKTLRDILDCFFCECCTLTEENGDIIEKIKTFNGYEVSLIIKRKED